MMDRLKRGRLGSLTRRLWLIAATLAGVISAALVATRL